MSSVPAQSHPKARSRSPSPRSGATAKKAAVNTQKTRASVAAFIAAIADDAKRADARAIDRMLRDVTGQEPALWGASIVGYGAYKNVTTAGEADWPKIGFSPRKSATVLYFDPSLLASHPLMKKLGKHKTGKSCLYIPKLADVDVKVLRALASESWKRTSDRHG